MHKIEKLALQPLRIGTQTLHFDLPIIMGILNITPDSFSDGGKFLNAETAVEHARALVAAGAQIVDVGGESTRPGAMAVDVNQELARVVPVLEALHRADLPAVVSIDTSKAVVAERALEIGPCIVNDVTGLRDPMMAQVIARTGAPVIIGHMRGEPRTMQVGELHYDDVVNDVRDGLAQSIAQLVAAGGTKSQALIDVGIGFGKTEQHNLALTRRLGELSDLGCPIVYGASRKQFLGAITGQREAADRDQATAAACVAAVLAGAHIFRVHDAAAVRDGLLVAHAIATV